MLNGLPSAEDSMQKIVDIVSHTPRRASTLAGQQIGKYDIIKVLGSGGMGDVYQARLTIPDASDLKNTYALKVIRSAVKDMERAQLRFKAEADALGRVNHPNVVRLVEVGEHEGQPYLVMDYVEGEPLDRHLVTLRRCLPFKEVVRLATDIAKGLSAAHKQEVIHRDLKPQNVLVTQEGRVHAR